MKSPSKTITEFAIERLTWLAEKRYDAERLFNQ